ncbi:MAG: hypothetical protein LBK26_02320, partial [Rickettsiales bacterium]|nr:hypothetical protein [Rickettsiales bacterium]
IIVLEQIEKGLNWRKYGKVFAQLKSSSDNDYSNYTFFNCQTETIFSKDKDNIKSKNVLSFEHLAQFETLAPDDKNAKFITEKTTFNKMTLEIDNFNKWLFPERTTLIKNKQNKVVYLDKDNNPCLPDRDADGFPCFNENIEKIEIPVKTIHKIIKISANLQIEIHSTPSLPVVADWHWGMNIYQTSKIEIVSKAPRPLDYFYNIVYYLMEFFTCIGKEACKVKYLYCRDIKNDRMSSFYSDVMPWAINSSKWDSWNSSYGKTNFPNIEPVLDKTLQKFIKKGRKLQGMIEYLSDFYEFRENEFPENRISQQVQLLETYGNMISKGANKFDNRKDVKSAINSIHNNIFKTIFIQPGLDKERIKKISKQDILNAKNNVSDILSELRNFITHPYINGKPKKLNAAILKSLKEDDYRLKDDSLNSLSHRIDRIIKWLLYKEIGLAAYFHD